MRTSLYGTPPPKPPQSDTTVLLVEPSAGYNSSQPMTDLQPGQTPYSRNLLYREGGMELRPTLSQYTSTPKTVDYVTGGMALISSVGTTYPVISGTTRFSQFTGGWSLLSYVSSAGRSTPPSGTTKDYYDFVQTYAANVDEMVAIAACQSYQTLFAYVAGATTFSSITSSPRARYLAAVDNFVVAANVRDVGSGQSKYIQRVQWSDRGDPLAWVSSNDNLAGFEDLLAARGGITRLMTQGEQLVIFFDDEIWQGTRMTGATSFSFTPLDKTIGCPFTWTVCQTPLGIMFLGRDLMIYLLPKGGGVATPVGYPVRRHLQDRLDNAPVAWSTYDQATNTFRLYYAALGGTGLPTEAIWLNLGENAWAPQNYGMNLTRGFPSLDQQIASGVSWTGMPVTWTSVSSTWEQLAGSAGGVRATSAVGTSDGTMYYDSSNTMDDQLPVTGTWRSQGLGADTPNHVKNLRTVRVDYNSKGMSNLTIRASRDQGTTFDPAVAVQMTPTASELGATAFVYTTALYPAIQVQTSDAGVRIFRFWLELRQGGRP